MSVEMKTKIANILANNHVSYMCSMAGKVINVTEENLKRIETSYLNRIDEIIYTVLNLKTEDNWVSKGNHKMTYTSWDYFYNLCANQ